MLKSLYIKDFALIEEIDVVFSGGLNIILGETGAGKSIFIGALGLLIGERASTDVIRKGSKKAIVEGIFDITDNQNVKNYLTEIDIDFDDELIIRREISAKGSNRIFLNDTPVTLSDIKFIGELLVDLHGQHAHQSLLKADKHIKFLDQFGNYENQIAIFRSKISELRKKINELRDLEKRESELKEKLDVYEFQLKQIDAVNPQENEDVELEQELKILEHSEEIFKIANFVYSLVYEGNNFDSAYDLLSEAQNQLQKLTEYDKTFEPYVEDLSNILSAVDDLGRFMGEYSSKIEIDENDLVSKQQRLGDLNMLKIKYGPTLKSVLEHREKIAREINLAKNFSDEIAKLSDEIKSLKIEAGKIAKEIYEGRKSASKFLEDKITELLKTIGFADVEFSVQITQEKTDNFNSVIINDKNFRYNSNGIDNVEFLISTNTGEDLKPLSKIASGGEISRIMLGLKALLAEKDEIPVMIFDEIDSGISGRIAQKVGALMRKLGNSHQIIAITHLPQIAAAGNHHYLISKIKKDERVQSQIKKLEGKEVLNEIARLISGDEINEAALKNAEALMP